MNGVDPRTTTVFALPGRIGPQLVTGEAPGKRFRFTENLLLFIVVAALSGAVAIAINSFIVSVGATYAIVHRQILRRLDQWSLHRQISNEHHDDEEGSESKWITVLRRVCKFVVNLLLRHPIRVADILSGPISLTVGVLLMAGLLHLASSGTVGIAITAIALIVMTVVDGTKHGYRRFLGITVVCAIVLIGIVIWVLVAMYLSTHSS